MKHIHTLLVALLLSATLFAATQKTETSVINNGNGVTPEKFFMENKGQIIDQNEKPNTEVKFLMGMNGLNVQLKANSFSYDAYKKDEDGTRHYHRVDVELVGANPQPKIEASEPSTTYFNFYTTGTPEEGVTHVRHYKQVLYRNIYEGIDLVFKPSSVNGKSVEYDFIVHPGADASKIKLKYKGALGTTIKNDKLILKLAHGILEEFIPKSFLSESGEQVAVNYSTTEGDNTVISFQTKNFDRSKTLIIDPVAVSWGTYYGGSNNDIINACSATGLYHAGFTNSTNNIATSGAHQTTLAGNNDGILLSISAGGVLQWATYLGGSQADQFNDLAHSGTSIFVGGRTMSSGLATTGVLQTTMSGTGGDGLIARFTTAGVRTWCTYFGGTGDDEITGIGFDTDVFVHGRTQSASGIATTGTHQTALAATGQYDAFVADISNVGATKFWATYYGGTGAETSKRLAVNLSLGYVAVVGLTASTTGIASTGAHKTSISGASDGYIAVFNTTNGTRTWGTYYGGGNVDDIINDCVIQTGTTPYLYFVGTTPTLVSVTGIASTGAFQTTAPITSGALIGKFTLATGVRQWCTFYGDEATSASSIIFAGNDLLIGGNCVNLADASAALLNTNSYCASGAPYLATFSQAGVRVGNIFRQCAANSPVNDVAYENSAGAYYMVGSTNSTVGGSIAGGTPIHQLTLGGVNDGYIVRFVNCTAPAQPGTITGSATVCQGSSQTYSIAAVSGATDYTWTLPSGWSGTSATTSITTTVGASSGTISVVANNACGSSTPRTLAVTVTTLPAQPGTITGSTTVCQTSSQTYSVAAVTGATSYTWTLPGGWSGTSTTNSITATVGASGGTISVVANNSCGSGPARTLSVTVSPVPTQPGTISGSATVCQGASQTYSIASVSGATSYTWTLPSGWTGSSTTTSINTTVGASSGNISVTANNTCGSSAAQTLAVTVNTLPAQPSAITGSITVCKGVTQAYSVTNVSGVTYAWNATGGTVSGSGNSVNITWNTSGAQTITVTPNNSCGSGTARTLAVTVGDVPAQPGAISGSSTVCQTSSQVYSITAVSGATSYTWTLPSGWSGSSTTNSITATVGASSGTISVVANNNCGSSTAQTISVTVNNTPPQPGTISGSSTVCAGSQQTYSIAAVSGATSYTWTLPSGWTGTSTTTSINVTVGSSDGTISVVANNACGASPQRTLGIFVNNVPAQPSTITGGNTACVGATQTYSVANVSGVTYAWNVTGGTVSGSGNSVSITWNTAGAQTITVTPSNSCGAGTPRTSNITVSDVPSQPGSISGSASVCQGSSQTYNVTAVSGATSYTWTLPSGWSGTSTTNSINATAGASSGNISVTANNACGSSSAQTLVVTVNTIPAQPSAINGSTSVCSGTTQTYSVTNVSGVTYAWNATGGTVSGSGNSVSITWNTAGTQTITVTPSNSCGTGTARTLSVTVNSGTALGQPGPISGATTVCSGTQQTYSIAAVSGATSYTWTLPSGWTGTSTTTSISATVGSNSGTVSVVANNSCGSGTAQTLNVTVNNVPAQLSTISGSTSPCVNSAYTYSVTNVSGVTYSWSASGGTVTGSGNSVSISFSTAGIQTITVTPSNSCGTGTARTLSVSVGSAPAQPGTISGSSTVCAGSQQTYSIAAVSGATSYTWTLPSGWTGTSTTTSINVTVGSSDGVISVVANNICGAGPARTLGIFVNTVPAQPSTITGGNIACVGATQTYSVANVSGVTYAWNVTGGTVSGSGNSVSITWNTAGAQTITVTPSNSCGAGTPRTSNITVSDVPSQPGSISGSASVCQGASQTYSIPVVTGATSYTWTLPSGWSGTASSNSITPTVGASSGSISVTANNACGSSTAQTLAVTVNTIPAQPSAINGSTTVCSGTTQTYSVTNVNGVTYAWNATGGTVSGSGNSVSITWNTAGTQTITVTPSNSCGTGTARTLSVTVNSGTALGQPGPISGATTVCSGTQQTYSIAVVSGATSYTWTLPSGWTGTSTTTSINAIAASSGTVSVVANNSCGSGTAQTLNVTVNTVPAQPSAITGSTTVCQGSSSTYSISVVTGATSYTWTLPNGWTGAVSSNSITPTAGSNGGTISVTANNTCGSSTAQTISVSIQNVPAQPGTISGNATVCQGTTQTYSVANVSGASSYTWTLPNGWSGTSTTNTISPTVNANSGTVSVTANNTCGSSAAQTLSVTASANPTASISPATVAICEGASATLTASGGAFYAWSNGGGSSASATFSPTSNTTYTVTVTNAANCSATATRLVTVNANPTATINPASASICAGASQSLTASGGTGYTWSNSLGSGATKSVSPTQTTTYTVTVSNANNCTATASATVTVNTVSASINGPTTICSGLQATLTASGGNSYAWSNSLGTNASVTVSPTSTTTYTVTVTGAGNCTATASQTVSVQSQPTAVINGPNTVCAGSSITLTANGGNTYTWANGLGSNASITVSPTSATTYTVTVSIGANCTATASKTVSIAQPTSSQIAQTICAGGSYNFGGNTLTQSGTYTDMLVNAAGCDSTVTLNLTVLAPITSNINASICQGGSYNFNGTLLTNAGTYTQTLQGASAQGCDSSVTLNLTVGSFIVSNISKTICAGETFVFNGKTLTQSGVYADTLTTATCDSIVNLTLTVNALPQPTITQNGNVLSTQTFNNYQWQLNNNNINGATAQSHTATQNGSYTVVVTDANGCSNTSSAVNVTIIGVTEIASFRTVIYPNPTTTILNIESSEEIQSIQVVDLMGRTIITENNLATRNLQLTTDLLAEATYFIQIKTTSGKIAVKTFVKQ